MQWIGNPSSNKISIVDMMKLGAFFLHQHSVHVLCHHATGSDRVMHAYKKEGKIIEIMLHLSNPTICWIQTYQILSTYAY